MLLPPLRGLAANAGLVDGVSARRIRRELSHNSSVVISLLSTCPGFDERFASALHSHQLFLVKRGGRFVYEEKLKATLQSLKGVSEESDKVLLGPPPWSPASCAA